MDPVTITALSTAAFNLIKPFFKTFAEGAVKKAGEETGKAVYDTVKAKLSTSAAGQEILADVARNPDDESNQNMLKLQLEKVLKNDPTFADELQKLLKEQGIGSSGGGVNVVNNASVGQQANVGQVHGGLTFNAGGTFPTAESDQTKGS